MSGYRVEQRQKARRRDTSPVLAWALVALLAMVPGIATAQHDVPVRQRTRPTARDRPRPRRARARWTRASRHARHDDWVRETRRKAWKDTKFDAQIRSYYFDRDKYDGSESEAWALGGSVGLKTGYFRERFALGATGYTSQRLHGPEDKDGTLLLAPGQHGYTVLGELYGEFLLNEDTRLSIGRRGIDTPYLNRNDSRMTPNTFEAITLQGLYGGGEGQAEWRVGAGYFDEIKERNSDEFVSMATVAGAPDGVERGRLRGRRQLQEGRSLDRCNRLLQRRHHQHLLHRDEVRAAAGR